VKLSQGIPTIAIVVGISGGALVSTLSDSASPVLLSCLAVPLLVLIYWKPHIGLCLVLFSLMMHGLYTVILPDVAIIGYVEPLLMVYVFCVVAIRNFRSQQIMGWVLRSRLGIAVLVFVAFGATRAAFSEDQLAAWLGFATLCLYSTGFFIVCGTVTDKRRFTGVVSFILAAIAITALLAVSAFIFDWRLIAGPGVEAGYGYIHGGHLWESDYLCKLHGLRHIDSVKSALGRETTVEACFLFSPDRLVCQCRSAGLHAIGLDRDINWHLCRCVE